MTPELKTALTNWNKALDSHLAACAVKDACAKDLGDALEAVENALGSQQGSPCVLMLDGNPIVYDPKNHKRRLNRLPRIGAD